MSRRIQVHIDRLILDGVDAGDPRAYQRAVELAIAAELGRPGAIGAISGREAASIDGGTVASGSDATLVGRHIAGRLGGGTR